MTLDRARLTQMMETLVDQAFAAETVPEGLVEDPGQEAQAPSQYEMWSALVALTQEVRLQGRAFKSLEETLTPVKEGLSGYGAAVDLARGTAEKAWAVSEQQLREARRQGEEKARQEFLGCLADTHDRLALSLGSAGAVRREIPQPRGWWLGGKKELASALEALDSALEGCRLSLESVGALMREYQLAPIACQGKPFDPQCMSVVAVETTASVPDGTVLEVLRPGYLHKGQPFRTVQVKVARQPNSEGDSNEQK